MILAQATEKCRRKRFQLYKLGGIKANPKQALNTCQNYIVNRKIRDGLIKTTDSLISCHREGCSSRKAPRWITRQRDASLVIFMLQTGLRLTETVSLQNSDVQLSSHQGNVSIRHGRTSRHRVVPLRTKHAGQ
jgi:site-specific recombinase XerC